jgi:hypothetical protein
MNMNKFWVLQNLREAQEELTRTIRQLESEPEYDEIEFQIALRHLYHHVNTAWNARNVDDQTYGAFDADFDSWRLFPHWRSNGRLKSVRRTRPLTGLGSPGLSPANSA